jgi:hypothetical protein
MVSQDLQLEREFAMKKNRGVTSIDVTVGLAIMCVLTTFIGCAKNNQPAEPQKTNSVPHQERQSMTFDDIKGSEDLGDGEVVKVTGEFKTGGVHYVYLQTQDGPRVHALEKDQKVSIGRDYKILLKEQGGVQKKVLVIK